MFDFYMPDRTIPFNAQGNLELKVFSVFSPFIDLNSRWTQIK